MSWAEISKEEYTSLFKNKYLSVFDSPQFADINHHRCDKVVHIVYKNSKVRFGLIGGVVENVLKLPFSAPYANITPSSNNEKLAHYCDALKELNNYIKEKKLGGISITLPPYIMHPSHLSKLTIALKANLFKLTSIDINHHFDLIEFNPDKYSNHLDIKSRQKLRTAFDNNLSFEIIKNLQVAYDIIKKNREFKGYPLRMSIDQLSQTLAEVNGFLHIVKDDKGTPIASCISFEVSVDVVQIIYWGNIPDSDILKPMNFMAFSIFCYFKQIGKKLIDIGPSSSTETNINFGLSDFKQSIGCNESLKVTFQA